MHTSDLYIRIRSSHAHEEKRKMINPRLDDKTRERAHSCIRHSSFSFSFAGCAFLTYYSRDSAISAQNALHEKRTLPGVSFSISIYLSIFALLTASLLPLPPLSFVISAAASNFLCRCID